MGHIYYTKTHIDYYQSQANELSLSRQVEKLGLLYYDYSPNNTFSKNDEDKIVFETSFTPYKGLKVYL
ncbi:MAG: hypothetical protein H0X26_00800 [Alphaproteobacteria bacterium]|nr:hypothetical protein [Alphaproteobacteria bacterium]